MGITSRWRGLEERRGEHCSPSGEAFASGWRRSWKWSARSIGTESSPASGSLSGYAPTARTSQRLWGGWTTGGPNTGPRPASDGELLPARSTETESSRVLSLLLDLGGYWPRSLHARVDTPLPDQHPAG